MKKSNLNVTNRKQNDYGSTTTHNQCSVIAAIDGESLIGNSTTVKSANYISLNAFKDSTGTERREACEIIIQNGNVNWRICKT